MVQHTSRTPSLSVNRNEKNAAAETSNPGDRKEGFPLYYSKASAETLVSPFCVRGTTPTFTHRRRPRTSSFAQKYQQVSSFEIRFSDPVSFVILRRERKQKLGRAFLCGGEKPIQLSECLPASFTPRTKAWNQLTNTRYTLMNRKSTRMVYCRAIALDSVPPAPIVFEWVERTSVFGAVLSSWARQTNAIISWPRIGDLPCSRFAF